MFNESFSVIEDDNITTVSRQVSPGERAARAEKTLGTTIYAKTLGMHRDLLASAIFRVCRGERQQLDITVQSATGANVRYRGQELRQDDARILEFLVHAVRNKAATDAIEFDIYAFAEHVGYDRHKRSVKRIDECLFRMCGAAVRIEKERGSVYVRQLIAKQDPGKTPNERVVWLHPEIVELFENNVTFLPLEERRQLSDGLASWLAGYVRANNETNLFKLEQLYAHSGSAGSMKTFSEALRDVMPKLQEAGVVKGFALSRGRLTVQR